MFDIGWTEIVVIIIVSCLALDIKDIPKIIKTCRKTFKHISDFSNEIKTFFVDLETQSRTLIDLEGKEQITYDIDDIEHIRPDIKKRNYDVEDAKK